MCCHLPMPRADVTNSSLLQPNQKFDSPHGSACVPTLCDLNSSLDCRRAGQDQKLRTLDGCWLAICQGLTACGLLGGLEIDSTYQ